jgi:hypothetical protein
MAGFTVDIYSDSPKVENILKEVTSHNDKEFAKAGFRVEYFKEKFGFSVIVMPLSMTAVVGFKIGKPIILKGLKSEIHKIEPDVKVEERKKAEGK